MGSRFKFNPPRKILLISVVTTSTCGIYLLRDSFRGTPYQETVTCEGKVAIVTGGNSGIGKETAKDLAKRGAKVYLLCRDMERCRKARKEIVLATRNRQVFARECDLGSLSSVRKFTEQFLKEQTRLDILVNNAGVWRVPYGKTKDGFEVHLGVNHMGHFFLTNLLLDLLKKSSPSRIINVSAASHAKGKINTEDLNSDNKYSEMEAYNQSKLANMLFSKELSERLKGTGVTANSVNPGYTSTGLYKLQSNSWSASFIQMLLQPIFWIFLRSPIGGAQSVIYAAIAPELENVTGKYFVDCHEEEVAPQAKDDYTAKWLWAVSEKWTRLREKPQDDSGTVVFS
ncbi:hypothetical protein RUM44_000886 [Polyplax serrata]|uniref:Retinol dehydrogenase 12 n=1 Tax=Polyplax serrata TaxID=468196 RepID=A0ABR1B6C0_POLSC